MLSCCVFFSAESFSHISGNDQALFIAGPPPRMRYEACKRELCAKDSRVETTTMPKAVAVQVRRTDRWCGKSPESVLSGIQRISAPVLLGLPCAQCRTYYDAQLDACPVCGCRERLWPREQSCSVILPRAVHSHLTQYSHSVH